MLSLSKSDSYFLFNYPNDNPQLQEACSIIADLYSRDKVVYIPVDAADKLNILVKPVSSSTLVILIVLLHFDSLLYIMTYTHTHMHKHIHKHKDK